MRQLGLLAGAAALAFVATPAGAQDFAGRMFERMDANSDGYIDAGELGARRVAMFDQADANDDDVLTAAEIEGFEPQGRFGGGQGGGRPDGGRFGGPGADGPRGAMMFQAADADGNGEITRAEFEAAPHPMLARADEDGDGRLSRAEFDAGRPGPGGRGGN
ncbi:MAG: hypothetical protein PVI23_07260 [Maricaulaceae bacterium]|jgi:hypothetical protein